MIEKLNTSLAKEINAYSMTQNQVVAGIIIDKINELVDVVNDLQKDYDNVCIWVGEQKLKAPTDPYAEQRKWIGKLCKFWDDEDEGYVYEILIDIEDDGSDYPYKMTDVDSENWTMSYKHCEPVSEDLIYKGE